MKRLVMKFWICAVAASAAAPCLAKTPAWSRHWSDGVAVVTFTEEADIARLAPALRIEPAGSLAAIHAAAGALTPVLVVASDAERHSWVIHKSPDAAAETVTIHRMARAEDAADCARPLAFPKKTVERHLRNGTPQALVQEIAHAFQERWPQ